MKNRLIILALFLLTALPASAQIRTTIADQLIPPQNGTVVGQMTITTNQTFTSLDGYTVLIGQKTYITLDATGSFSVQLVPNIGASPFGTSYSVDYSTSTARFHENWVVPLSGTTIHLSGVRVLWPTAPAIMIPIAQLLPPNGCISGQVPSWTSSGWTCVNNAGGTVFQVNGTGLISSSTINFVAGANVTITNGSAGNITIAATGGGGGLTSVGLTMPSWFSVANSPLVANGTLAVTAAAAQTSHQVIGTCGSATSFAPCGLVAGDLPATLVYTGQANTFGAFLQDLSASSIKIPTSAAFVSTASAMLGYDSTNKNVHIFSNAVDNINVEMPASISPANNDCAKFTVSGSVITLNTAGAACGSGGSMTWPGVAGIAVYAGGSAWGTSLAEVNGDIIVGSGGAWTVTGTLPHSALPALLSGDIPNNAANTSGTAATITGALALANTPLTTTQDILYDNAGALARLPIVTSGNCLGNTGGVWASLSCSGSGFANPMTTLGDIIYENATPAAARLAGPTTPNGVQQVLVSTPSGGVATAVVWALSGIAGRNVSAGPDTIVATDRTTTVTYASGSAVAVTLTSAATLGSNFAFASQNQGAGTVTFTPGAGQINGASSWAMTQGENCSISSPDNTNYLARCAPGHIVAGANITFTPTAYGVSIAASGSGMTWPGSAGIAVYSGSSSWSSSLTAPAGNLVGTGQANTYTTGLQSFASATMSLPSSAGYAPTTANLFGYDSTNNRAVLGNGTNTSYLTWITAAPTTAHMAVWSGTLGALTDGGVVPTTMTYPSGSGFAIVSGGTSWGTTLASPLPLANGGTNATSASAALVNLLPAGTRIGDVLYCSAYTASACTAWTLAAGNNSGTAWLQETSGGVPSWTVPGGGGNVSNSGSPAQYQVAAWVSSTTIEGIGPGASNMPLLGGGASAYPAFSTIAYVASIAANHFVIASSTTQLADAGVNLTWSSPTLTTGVSGTTTGTHVFASSGAGGSVTLTPGVITAAYIATFPAVTTILLGETATDNTTTHVLHATATNGVGIFGVIATGDLPTGIPIGNVGSSGLSGTAPVAISAAGAISCSTCLTATTPTQYGVMLGAGTQALGVTAAAGGANFPLVSQSSANPVWSTVAHPSSLTQGGLIYASSTTAMAGGSALTQYGVVLAGAVGSSPVSTAQGASNMPLIGQAAANPIWSAVAIPTAAVTQGGLLYSSTTTAISVGGALTQYGVVVAGAVGSAPQSTAAAASGTLLQGTASSNPSFTATPVLGVDNSVAGTIQLANGSAAFHTIISSGATATWTMKLPATAGTNLYVLQTDGSGNTSWVAQSGSGSLALGSGTGTSGALACATASNTQGNCTALPPTNVLGVFNSTTTYLTVGVVSVLIDATQNVVFGDNLCASSTGAHLAHDNGAVACATGQAIGIVTTTASSVSTVTASLRLQ